MTNINCFFVEFAELNNTERQKMKSSFNKRMYYSKNVLSISKIAKLRKRKKQWKKQWKA